MKRFLSWLGVIVFACLLLSGCLRLDYIPGGGDNPIEIPKTWRDLSEAEELKVRVAARKHLEEHFCATEWGYSVPLELVQIKHYMGAYSDCIVVVLEKHSTRVLGPVITVKISGVLFNFPEFIYGEDHIFVYKEGTIYSLFDEEEHGNLTKTDIEDICLQHKKFFPGLYNIGE